MTTISLGDFMKAPDVKALVDNSRNYPDEESCISSEQAFLIILATLRLYGCCKGSFAGAYAFDALVAAIGKTMAESIVRRIRIDEERATP
jgi:hypothetical protein